MKNKKTSFRINRRGLLYGLAAVLLVAALVLLYRVAQWWEFHNSAVTVSDEASIYPADQTPTIQVGDVTYTLRKNVEAVLVLGIDKFEADAAGSDSYRNDQQADYLLLLLLDHDRETITPLELNRDTMAEIPVLGVGNKEAGSVQGQLALAHTYGDGGAVSCENTVKAVSDFLYGTEIAHYLAFTMDAVPALNDAVGGVTPEVLDDFSQVDSTLVQGETVTLQGGQALTYVRARGGMEDSTNLNRMARQRQYFAALVQQLHTLLQQDDNLPATLLEQINPYLTSDYTVQELSNLFTKLEDYALSEIETIAGTAEQGEAFMEFYADEDALRAQLLELLYEPVA